MKVKPKTLALGAVVAVLGALTVRAWWHHHHPGGTAAPAARGGPGLGYDVPVLVVTAALLALAIWLHHHRGIIRMRQEFCEVGGWKRRRSWHLNETWECPACGAICATWEGVNVHEADSVCAAYTRWLAANDGLDPDRGKVVSVPPWAAHEAQQANRAAELPPDHSVTAGAVDTFSE